MNLISALFVAGLTQAAPPAQPPIEFHFTNDAVIEQGADAAIAQWQARCVAGGEFADFAQAYAPDARMSVGERKTQGATFDRREFARIATAAWEKANAALPQGPLRVCVDLARAADTFTRDAMRGVAGVTAGRGRVILRIHPDAEWQAALPYALAHEMHHSYWVRHHFDAKAPFTLADYLALEGRADYFAATMFTFKAPWTAALDAAAYATAWTAMSKQLNVTEWSTLQAAMFGAPQAGIPAWAGYSVGYRLVSERMTRTPPLDLKAMTAAPASEFMPAPAGQ
jgi:hypothetical protein